MLSFLFKTLRFLLIVGVVLFVGQIPVQGRTVGEHFAAWVTASFKSTQAKISKSSLVASLPRYLNQKDDRKVSGEAQKSADHESISSSDRESLLRVLQ